MPEGCLQAEECQICLLAFYFFFNLVLKDDSAVWRLKWEGTGRTAAVQSGNVGLHKGGTAESEKNGQF